jgi:hypothetical protein
MSEFLNSLLTPNKFNEDEMGGACSTNVCEEECIKDIGGKARKKKSTRKNKT